MNDSITVQDIDPNALDEQWLMQPSLYRKYAGKLAQARDQVGTCEIGVDVCKTELKEIEAEIRLDITANFEQYGYKKIPTLDTITATILTNEKVKKAQGKLTTAKRSLNDAWTNVNLCQAIVSALDMKKVALQELVRLHSQSYFATPWIPSTDEGRSFVEEVKKRKARVHSRKKKKANKDVG
jgi:hypothetical protein